jgi:hypothetical protein
MPNRHYNLPGVKAHKSLDPGASLRASNHARQTRMDLRYSLSFSKGPEAR